MNDNYTKFSIAVGANSELPFVALSEIIVNVCNMIEELNIELQTGINLRVVLISKQPENEIYEFKLYSSAIGTLPSIITSEKLSSNLHILLLTLDSIFDRLQDLQYKKAADARKVDSIIEVINNRGDCVNFTPVEYSLLFENNRFRKSFNSFLKSLSHNNLNYMALLNEDKNEIFRVSREQVSLIPTVDLSPKRIVKKVSRIFVIKLGFEENLTWDVIYKGEKKSVYIKDKSFWEAVNNGDVNFGSGVELSVELEIEQKFHGHYGDFFDADIISITKVLGILKSKKQLELYSDLIPDRRSRTTNLGQYRRLK